MALLGAAARSLLRPPRALLPTSCSAHLLRPPCASLGVGVGLGLFAAPSLACSGGLTAAAAGAAGRRGFAVFGFPPEKKTYRYGGIHCHPGMVFGYKHPRKRQGKVRRLPNVRLRHYDFSLTPSPDGQFKFRPPYPPRSNRTIEVLPPWGAKKNPWPTTEHKSYPLRWKNIEYVYEPRLMRKPHGHGSQRWSGPVTRIEHHGGGKTTSTLVTHDYRLLEKVE